MTRPSTMKRVSTRIWTEQTDLPVPPEMTTRLTAVAWRLWSKVGNKWRSALAHAACRAMEEASLFGGDPLTLLVERPFRMARKGPRGRVGLYLPRAPVRVEQVRGFGFRPSDMGE